MNWVDLLSSKRTGKNAQASEPSRSAFEQDYDRIIFSHPFRRLQDKTQVHPLPEHDFVHTRLTHSLEVSSVGRSLGKSVGEVVIQRHPALAQKFSAFDFGAIVAAASLAHDLGNPPFGHSGEEAISDFFKHHDLGRSFESQVSPNQWKDLIQFEGNAQGFRLLTLNQFGLKLTHATLGAFTKYPCTSFFNNRDTGKKSQKKFGFFETESAQFAEIAEQLGLARADDFCWTRHPLAFLVEAADDICYSIIDLEDGCRLGLVSFDETLELLSGILGNRLSKSKLTSIQGLNEQLGVLRAMAISALTEECANQFLDNEEKVLNGGFDVALTDTCRFKSELMEIGKVSAQKIYRSRAVTEVEASGFVALPGLLEGFILAAFDIQHKNQPKKYGTMARLIPAEISSRIQSSVGIYEALRLVIDFVSGLTDRHALSLYRKITGIAV